MNNSIFRNDKIIATGNIRLAAEFYKHIIKPLAIRKSILDIGCGDGIVMEQLTDESGYKGLDIGAGCYSESTSSMVQYFRNLEDLISEIKVCNPDITLLINVLEHTFDFFGLFDLAAQQTKEYIFVSLPNEENIHLKWDYLVGKGILSHGLDMVNKHVNHRHLWLIQEKLASTILDDHAHQHGFKRVKTYYTISYPNTYYKRLIYIAVTSFLPWRAKSRCFAFLYKKMNNSSVEASD